MPGLRNVELTGPYFHNGGVLTLMQVVDFYIRGGNFHEANLADLDPFIADINGLKGADKEGDRRDLVNFLIALTDERVRQETAPFDHPGCSSPTAMKTASKGIPSEAAPWPTGCAKCPRLVPAAGQPRGCRR